MSASFRQDAARAPRACFLSALLALVLPFAPGVAGASAPSDIEIVDARGEVRVASGGQERDAKAGSALVPSVSLRTGRDGWADLRQGETTLGVGPDTRLEFPAAAGGAADRIVQPSGHAFYTVAPRQQSRLRVETPYLVAVVKGTQFNVVVDAESSTISLYEGSLEVRATEVDAVVQLSAGEIATRRRGEPGIRVIRMSERAAAPAVQKGQGGGDNEDGDGAASGPAGADVTAGADAALGSDGSIDAGASLDVDVSALPLNSVDGSASLDAGLSMQGLTGVQAEADATLDGSVLGVDVGADVAADLGADLGAGTADASLDVGVELGPVAVDAGVDLGVDPLGTGVDLGIDLGIDPGVDTGGQESTGSGELLPLPLPLPGLGL